MWLFGLWLLLSFRVGQGPDYHAYEYAFNILNTNPFQEFFYGHLIGGNGMEPGFRFFGSLLKTVGLTYQQYLAVIGAITLFFVAKLLRYSATNPTLTVILFYSMFFFTWPFSGIRAAIVICIGLYALISCGSDRRHVKFLFIVLALSMVHLTALVLLIFYLFFVMNLRAGHYLAMITITIPMLALQEQLFTLLFQLPFADRLEFYKEDNPSIGIFDIQSVARLVVFLFVCSLVYLGGKTDETTRRLFQIYFASVCAYFCLFSSQIFATQLSVYGLFVLILLFPRLLCNFQRATNVVVILGFLLTFSAAFLHKEVSYMHAASISNLENKPRYELPDEGF